MPSSLPTRPVNAVFRYPPSTINDLLAASSRAFPDEPAIVAPGRESLTHAALAERLAAVGHALAARGLGRGSRIGVALPEGPESVVAILAACSAAACAPLNPDLDEETLHRQSVALRVDALMAPAGADSSARRGARRAGIPVIDVHSSHAGTAGAFTLAGDTGRRAVDLRRPELGDIALLMQTSGTTSASKIAPGTHRRLAEAARARAELTALTHRDRCLLMIPLFNNTGIRRCVLPALACGGSVACVGPFRVECFVEWLERLSPTFHMGSIATQVAVAELLERHDGPIRHSLRFVLCGGATVPGDVAERIERVLGAPVLQGYGMTETGNIAQAPLPPRRAPPRSSGLPSNVDVAILDEHGREVAPGETGEIVVRGPEVFDGYENNPEANAAAFRDGWFRTGDRGYFDGDGFLYVAGRIKDLINRGGAKVSPADVEDALARHPQVVEAAAFALAHPTLGEDLAAAVVLRDPLAVSEAELREHARALLAPFKVPTRIVVVDEIPHGSFGKVKRAELASVAEAALHSKFVAPRDDTEMEIARAFAEVLGVERIGAHENFFQLGGDSLRATRVVDRLRSNLGTTLGPDALFRHPTTAEFAAAVAGAATNAQSGAPPSLAALPRSTYARDRLSLSAPTKGRK